MSIKDLIRKDIKQTEMVMDEWAVRHPEFRSVYVYRGVKGDPLYIDGVFYILYNQFLAIRGDQEVVWEVEF